MHIWLVRGYGTNLATQHISARYELSLSVIRKLTLGLYIALVGVALAMVAVFLPRSPVVKHQLETLDVSELQKRSSFAQRVGTRAFLVAIFGGIPFAVLAGILHGTRFSAISAWVGAGTAFFGMPLGFYFYGVASAASSIAKNKEGAVTEAPNKKFDQ
jgi:hypothetical protein